MLRKGVLGGKKEFKRLKEVLKKTLGKRQVFRYAGWKNDQRHRKKKFIDGKKTDKEKICLMENKKTTNSLMKKSWNKDYEPQDVKNYVCLINTRFKSIQRL